MAFEGDLSHLSLGDVLQTLAMSRQTGTFVIRGSSEERRLVFGPRGCGLLTVRQATRERVADYLVGRGKITEEVHDQVLRMARRRKETPLDDLLSEKAAVSEADLTEARRYVSAEEIYDLFLWTQGNFEFLSSDTNDQSPWGNLWFDVASIAMEAARRMDEVGRLRGTCPLGEVWVRENVTGGPEPSKLGRDAALVWSIVDGTRTVEGLLAISPVGRFDTWKALDSLRESGLLRLASHAEMAAAADELLRAKDNAGAAAMLRRMLEEDPADANARRSLVSVLVAANEKRGAAIEHVTIAAYALEAGDTAAATEAYRQATKLDKECAPAFDGLARCLFANGDAEGGGEAARTAIALHLEAKEAGEAVDLADLAVQTRPDDAVLRIALANAQVAAGDPASGLLTLDEAASLLETTGGDERRLADVYRRILQLDPTRKDCTRRIEQIESSERFRRRRTMQRLAIAAGVCVAAMAAIPVFSGPPFEVRIEEARVAIAEDRMADAEAILTELEADGPDEDEAIEISVVRNVAATKGPRAKLEEAAGRVAAALRRMSDDVVAAQAKGWAPVLHVYETAIDALDGPDGRAVAAADLGRMNQLRNDFLDDYAASLQALAADCAQRAGAVTTARERFTPDAFKKEDPDTLADLVKRTEEVEAIRTSQDWTEVARLLEGLRRRVPRVKDALDRKAAESLQTMADGFTPVAREGARALALLRKKQLLDRHRDTHTKSRELMGHGRLDEAAESCRTFLAVCDELRNAEPRELYEPVVRDYVDGMNLEAPVRERLTEIETIREAEQSADAAVEKGDMAGAYRIRSELVRAHRSVDFRTRFRLPVRIESRPAGATAWLLDGSAAGRPLGTTPVAHFEYAIDEPVRIALRLEGFDERVVERRGALEDESGLVAVELPKKAEFVAQGVGNVQAAPIACDVAVLLAGRDGRVRRVSGADGSQDVAPFETGSLAGMSASPAVLGARAIAATLDGEGFVLDARTLTKLRDIRFDGPVRAALLAVGPGIVAVTEAGTAQLLDGEGRAVWTKSVGRVAQDPAAAGSRVVFVTTAGEVVALDAATGGGEVRVRLPDEPRWGAPAVAGDRVYVAGDSGTVACVDLARRRVAWSISTQTSLRARPCPVGSCVVVATAQGAILRLDAADGREVSRELLGGPVRHAPLALGDGYLVTTDRGAMLRFAADGNVLWRFDAKDEVTAPPALCAGRVVIVTKRGALIALRP